MISQFPEAKRASFGIPLLTSDLFCSKFFSTNLLQTAPRLVVSKLDLKNILKKLKLNEDNISMVLGVLVIIVTGILVVNYFKSVNGGKLFKTGDTSSTKTEDVKKHVVAKGESLWKIAVATYGDGYKWTEIAKANNIQTPNSIEVGQELTLPELGEKTEAKAEVKDTAGTNVSITGATYEVVKGDNLWTIAVRAYGDGYQWVKIARENKLVNPNLIYPGNLLALPR